MLVEIKYIRKDEPKTLRRMRKAQFMAESKDDGRAMFNKWCWDNDIDWVHDVMVMSIRDATTDNIVLDVQDVKQTQKGKI